MIVYYKTLIEGGIPGYLAEDLARDYNRHLVETRSWARPNLSGLRGDLASVEAKLDGGRGEEALGPA